MFICLFFLSTCLSICVHVSALSPFCLQKAEALESGSKRFEDLEFRQLERESSLEEEKETVSRQLLQEKAEYQRSMAKRKVLSLISDNLMACYSVCWWGGGWWGCL